MSVPPQGQSVVALPGLSPASLGVVVSVALVDAPALLARGSEPAALAVLVDRLDDPVDAGVAADGLVLRVDEDDLKVFIGRVLVNPVGVEDAQVGATAADALLGSRSQGALVLQLVHTLVGRLAVGGTLGNRPLATSTTDADAVDDISLLGLVSETASLVGTGWSRGTMADR